MSNATKDLPQNKASRGSSCKDKYKEKSYFIKTLSSQMQLPLNQLIQLSNIALHKIQRKETQLSGDYLIEIKWISEELLIYINDLVELSELKTGESEFALEEIDTVYFLETMRRQFQPIADNREVSLSLSTNVDKPCILADYSKLSKVLNILLRTGFRHSPEKGAVEIYAQQKNRDVEISISFKSNDPKNLNNSDVFNMSEEHYLERREGLMDFSLSICKELMLGQGGDIFIDENLQTSNNCFILTLPVAQSLLDD